MTTTEHPTKEFPPRWLNLKQAGEYMGGKTAEGVRMMLRRAQLGYVQQGRRLFIDRQEIDRLMESRKVKAS